ncbi:MAG: LolA family protein [Blastocatellia bacterium]|jgi:outer membrane lipoprotein-sorting protein
MRRLICALAILIMTSALALAQGSDAKAEQILKQARAAIADEGKYKSLVGLQATGTIRQTFGERQMESELEIEMMAPDKIKKSQISTFGTIVTAINGDQLWTDFVPAVGMGAGGGMMRGMGGAGGAGSPMATFMQTQQKRELVQTMLGWLMLAPPSSQLQFTFVGEAPGPEGVKLEVIDGKAAEGWSVRLYFNQEDHHLFGLSYKSKQMRRNFGGGRPGGQPAQGQQTGQGAQGTRPAQGAQQQPAQPAAQGQQPGQSGQRPQMTPEERERRTKEMMEQLEKSPDVDFRWVFEDYKGVGGFNLPHRMTKIEAGTPNEEWNFSKIKLNAKITADRFTKKDK